MVKERIYKEILKNINFWLNLNRKPPNGNPKEVPIKASKTWLEKNYKIHREAFKEHSLTREYYNEN